MNYTAISTPEPVVDYLTDQLKSALDAGKTVAWFIPGGSALGVAIDVAQRLTDTPLDTLRVTLTDERYGEIDHPDENWRQLLSAGFSLPGATLYRVVQPGLARRETTERFGATIEHFLDESDFAIGFFGIGADGHTAGIKPHAFSMDTPAYAASFVGEDFERITITPRAIARLDIAVAYACGSGKRTVLQSLLRDDFALDDQPAQSLKTAGTFQLFTDQHLEESL